ncbi:hypothetical protein IV203_032799 [Nitzschia inconspicua]|uniref:Uncharacterized protein n=1 Tax=Nitzschia inconspicua TaxID=303405 RepID=A0A9K3PFA0_9STRA|nr:hypothetical protein IV203_032799 [Nitzschia inconspicua]
MDNNIHINQYDSMSSTGPETPSAGAAGLTSLHFTPPIPRLMYVAGPNPDAANHSPLEVENSPAMGRDIADPQIDPASNALAADVVTEAPTVAVENPYTPEQLAVIEEIAEEASSMFCVDATFQSSGELRDASINTKGWPINTIAMLDGEKKVCLPCEGFTIHETIDGYVWLMESVVAMAPGRKLCDIKFIIGDGIFAAETILTKLGIEDTCHVILDHHHLLILEIGSWPKAFGLNLFLHLKEDLTLMVKSTTFTAYQQALESARAKLCNHPDQKHAKYLERHIHSMRHLFANHIIQKFASHASIVARIGSLVMEPVTLIESLMERHLSISSERNHCISVRLVQCQALAVQSTGVATREALKGLSSWGFDRHRGMHLCCLGGHGWNYSVLPSASTAGWLLQGKWCARWHQRTALGTSPRSRESSAEQQQGLDHPPEGDDDMSMRYCGFGDEDVSVGKEDMSDGEEACSFTREEASRREDPATSQEVHAVSRPDTVP